MKVKLQPPSGTALSPFSPAQPPAAITQVMLLANPMKVSRGEPRVYFPSPHQGQWLGVGGCGGMGPYLQHRGPATQQGSREEDNLLRR
jgi:hypothetical protein